MINDKRIEEWWTYEDDELIPNENGRYPVKFSLHKKN